MNYTINTINKAGRLAVLQHLYNNGYRTIIGDRGAQENNDRWRIESIWVRINSDNKIVDASHYKDSNKEISFAELFALDLITPKSKFVVLNKEHKAEVFKDKIVVGCQSFPITILDELIKARYEL